MYVPLILMCWIIYYYYYLIYYFALRWCTQHTQAEFLTWSVRILLKLANISSVGQPLHNRLMRIRSLFSNVWFIFSSCLCLLCSLNELLILSLMFFIERKYISTFHPALKVKCILFVCCTGFVHIKNWVWFCWTVEVWWILMIHLGVWFVFMKSTFVKYKVVFSSFPLLFLFVCFSFVLF